ncbi:hypothetical protein R3P38DRAFT_2499179 [Favolaschia claudopus]|uniref:Uncharacterized protein n=1 Tax=Favolaschia claudopus TaxID=2862362 RepID=A0AAW0DVK3_9AGAR
MSDPSLGRPLLNPTLTGYPLLQQFKDTSTQSSRSGIILNPSVAFQNLMSASINTLTELRRWTSASTGLPIDDLSYATCGQLFLEVQSRAKEALRILQSFQQTQLARLDDLPKRHKTQFSIVQQLAQDVWESEDDNSDPEDDAFTAADSGSDADDEIALVEDEDEWRMDVDDIQEDSPLDTSSQMEVADNDYQTFIKLTPDDKHAGLWTATFRANAQWWYDLCCHWNSVLHRTFFESQSVETNTAYKEAVLVLRQMRQVHLTTTDWVQVVHRSGLGKTICDISEQSMLVEGNNAAADQMFLQNRAQDSFCETLDKWVKESVDWKCTPLQFKAIPLPGSQPMDQQHPHGPGFKLWQILKQDDDFIPRRRLPNSICLFTSEITFQRAWDEWLAPKLQKNYDLTHVVPAQLYSTFMQVIREQQRKIKSLKPAFGKILTRTIELRKYDQNTTTWVHKRRPVDGSANHLPPNACPKCVSEREASWCRKQITVRQQDVEWLRGHGITLAPPGERLKPKPRPAEHADRPPPKIFSPDELALQGCILTAIKKEEAIVTRCGTQIIELCSADGKVLDVVVYGAFPQDVLERMKEHHHTPTKCKPLLRGSQFEGLGGGKMEAHGSALPKGGRGGSAYGPIAGFTANSLDDMDIIFNEVEDNTMMMIAMRAYLPEGYQELLKETEAADKLGKTGTTTYRCTKYSAPQHTDEDVCRGCCMTIEWHANPGEYGFCFPSYGYYVMTEANTFWTFLSSMLHGTMLPSSKPMADSEPAGEMSRMRGGAGRRRRNPVLTPRGERAARRNVLRGDPDPTRTVNGKHSTGTKKNTGKAKSYQAAREKQAPRREYWNA